MKNPEVKPDMIPSISAFYLFIYYFFKPRFYSGEDASTSFIFSVLCKFLNTC